MCVVAGEHGPIGDLAHVGPQDLDTAIDFYSKMFAAPPAKVREGYANFAIETTGVDDTVCCNAEKTETWVHAPDGNRWEWYVKHADAEQLVNTVTTSSCCP